MIDTTDRLDMWRMLIESAGLGVNVDRLRELCVRWGVNPTDLPNYLIREDGCGGGHG